MYLWHTLRCFTFSVKLKSIFTKQLKIIYGTAIIMLDRLFDYFSSSTFNLLTAQLHHESQCRNEDIFLYEAQNVFHTKRNTSLRQTFDWHIRLHICHRLTKTMTFRKWLRMKLNLQSHTPK